MILNEQGYKIVPLPLPTPEVLASFDNLPVDKYNVGTQRRHRFSQYRVSFKDGAWWMQKLPHRPLLQSDTYNNKSGNIRRFIEPVEADFSPWVDSVFKAGGLDTSKDWHFDINQYRVVSTPGTKGISVPEGAHQDGHSFVLIFVFRREQINGAKLQLLPLDGKPAFFDQVIKAEEAIILNDRVMKHDATPIEAKGEHGYRDFLGTALNPWEERRYGESFESEALEQEVEA